MDNSKTACKQPADDALAKIVQMYESGDPYVIGFINGYVEGRNSQHIAEKSA